MDQTVPESIIEQCEHCATPFETGFRRSSNSFCPECRRPITRRLRTNSLVELVPESLGVPCPNREKGCNFILPSMDCSEHRRSCLFRQTPICKLIGFKECSFVSSQPYLVYRHIMEAHKVKTFIAPPKGAITFKDFGYFSNKPHDISGRMLWEVIYEDRSVSRFLIFREVDQAKSDYIFVCFHMGESSQEAAQHMVEISIRDSCKKTTKWKWTGEATNFLEAEDHMESPPFRIPIKYLKKHHVGGEDVSDLVWEITVTKSLE